MGKRKQLITADQFRELARPTSTHLDEDEVNAYIRECEDANIIPAIGYERFKAATEQGEWGDSVLPDFQPATFPGRWRIHHQEEWRLQPRRNQGAEVHKRNTQGTRLFHVCEVFFVPMAQL